MILFSLMATMSIAQEGQPKNSPFKGLAAHAFQNNTHFINILNSGDEALLARVHLIREAARSIHVQTFVWNNDEVGRLMMYELIEAAKRGVHVKILVDYYLVEKNPGIMAYFSTVHPNFQIKVYNPTTNKIVPSKLDTLSSWTLRFLEVNQRMHNKTFIVDGEIAITGGRNYSNEYFDRGINRNFKDRDALVAGPVVTEIEKSFDEYWNFEPSVSIGDMADVKRLIKKGNFKQFKTKDSFMLGSSFDSLDRCASDQECIKETFVQRGYRVKAVRFVADKPGKKEKIGSHKVTTMIIELGKLITQAEESIVMQTPYLVIGKKGTKFFKELRQNNPEIDILVSSNSLAAADHAHAYAFSYKNKKKYLKDFKWRIFELKPIPADHGQMIVPIKEIERSSKYHGTIHAKSFVFDHKKVWIGSFNIDPRSANLNTEVGLIIEDKEVALAVENDIRRDMAPQNSWTIGKKKNVPAVSHMSGLIGSVMRLVPGLDIWPYQYSTSFELKEGKEELPFYHEDFYKHYESVGPFPGMRFSKKEIEARLIKGFLGPIEPLI